MRTRPIAEFRCTRRTDTLSTRTHLTGRADIATGAAVVIIATQVDAGARAIGLTGRAAARKSRLITEAATALFAIATAVAVRLTRGLGEGCPYAA